VKPNATTAAERRQVDEQRAWVALVGPEVEDNLGLRYLASALVEAGFDVEILPFNSQEDLPPVLEAILAARPAPVLVGVSLAFQWRALDVLALVVALGERGFAGHVTAGGHFGSLSRDELLRDFAELDSICCYEAEQTIVALARALVSGSPLDDVGGLAFRASDGSIEVPPIDGSPPLGELAWPDRRGEPTSCLGHGIAPLVASRGCYANCAFCCIAAWHKQAPPAERVRMRPVDDVAREMAWLQRDHGIDLFVFHDDDFFLPVRARSIERIEALGAALRAESVGPIGTVVKARPNDLDDEVLGAMKRELGLIRLFLGVETDATQGLRTLRRGVRQQQNHEAMARLAAHGVYVCFNLLVFDPDTTVEDLETNLQFMTRYADCPYNFGRVELYAGTPLLGRMQVEGRCRGDYLGWDYRLADEVMQRVFELFIRCFRPRNFAKGALANRLMGTRFDAEVCRRFHGDRYQARWLERSKELSRTLSLDSVSGLREIVAFAGQQETAQAARRFVAELSGRLRQTERDVLGGATALEGEIQGAVGARCRHAKRALSLGTIPRRRTEGMLSKGQRGSSA
jgi:radical SAM superfamily enzyme YgiQ (UPF0313 family)